MPAKANVTLPENAAALVNEANRHSYLGKLGIVVKEWTLDRVVATMPVQGNTQPDGFLHGGATMSLAETLASMGAAGVAGWPQKLVMGLQQTCNFLSTASSGLVRGVATPVNIGRTTQLWNVDITSMETGRCVASARITIAVREPRRSAEETAGEPAEEIVEPAEGIVETAEEA